MRRLHEYISLLNFSLATFLGWGWGETSHVPSMFQYFFVVGLRPKKVSAPKAKSLHLEMCYQKEEKLTLEKKEN